MACHVSNQGVGESLPRPSKRENGRVRWGVEARRGRPDLSPLRASALMLPFSCHLPGRRRWGRALLAWWGWVGAVGVGRAGGEGAPPDAA